MDQCEFLVQGSAPEPYKVTFCKEGANLYAYCTCPAGKNGQYCKHRFNIMAGSIKGIVSNNTDDVATVKSWLTGTDVEKAILQVTELENEVETLNRRLSAAKKTIAKAMRD